MKKTLFLILSLLIFAFITSCNKEVSPVPQAEEAAPGGQSTSLLPDDEKAVVDTTASQTESQKEPNQIIKAETGVKSTPDSGTGIKTADNNAITADNGQTKAHGNTGVQSASNADTVKETKPASGSAEAAAKDNSQAVSPASATATNKDAGVQNSQEIKPAQTINNNNEPLPEPVNEPALASQSAAPEVKMEEPAPVIAEAVETPGEPETANTVKISIYCVDRFILQETEAEFKEGETVFDVLKQVTKDNSVLIDYKGNGSTAYIMGIDNVYEFDMGPESGWIYSVNGVHAKNSCGAYKISKGDVIKWTYTEKAKF